MRAGATGRGREGRKGEGERSDRETWDASEAYEWPKRERNGAMLIADEEAWQAMQGSSPYAAAMRLYTGPSYTGAF